MMLDGKRQQAHFRSDRIAVESPENPLDIMVFTQDSVQEALASYEEARLKSLPVFLPDGTLITGDNLDEEPLLDYFMKYVYKPNGIGTPPLTEYDLWLKETYGKSYTQKTLEYTIQGDYADEVTGWGIFARTLLGFTGADLPMDISDLSEKFYNWEWSWSHAKDTGAIVLSMFPFLGAFKSFKKIKNLDDAEEIISGIRRGGGTFYDEVGKLNTIKRLPDGTYEILDSNGKLVKKLDNEADVLDAMGIKIAEGTSKVDCPECTISRSKYPETAQHIEDAIKNGHPDTLTIKRDGAKANRKESLKGHEKVSGKDLDEYPPAMFEEGGKGASVRPISPSDNRGAGSTIGHQLRQYPDGTQIKIKIDD